jgi:hypothetical protein
MKRRLAFTLLLSISAFLLASPGASAKLVSFQTVDHKVGCIMDGQGVRCDAKNPKFDPGPAPADCELDYGQGVFVGRHDPPDFVCAGDTALNRDAEELPWQHGEKVKAGRFHCKALDNFTIKCRNKKNKYGFVISRYEVHFLDKGGIAGKAAKRGHFKFFQSPSGNIACAMGGGAVRCDILEHSWNPPPKPSSCDVDWGNGVQVGRKGAASFVCAGDSVFSPSNPVLGYGEKIFKNRFKCVSKQKGMRCKNQKSGRGFLLARDDVDLF